MPLASDARAMAAVARTLYAATGRTFTAVHIRGADAGSRALIVVGVDEHRVRQVTRGGMV